MHTGRSPQLGDLPGNYPAAELVANLRAGDRQAYAVAVGHYFDMVYAVAYGMLGNREDAEDVSQDVFLALLKSARRLSPRTSLRAYLYSICLNRCRDLLRRHRRRPRQSAFEEVDDLHSAYSDPHFSAVDELFRRDLMDCLDELSSPQRAAFVLCHFQGLNDQEIAEVLNCAPGTARSHLYRALVKVREGMQHWSDAPLSLSARGETI